MIVILCISFKNLSMEKLYLVGKTITFLYVLVHLKKAIIQAHFICEVAILWVKNSIGK